MKKKKVLLFILIIIIVTAIVGGSIYFYKKNNPKKQDDDKREAVILNSIDEYGITLSDLDSELYKSEYEVLKANLESDNINYEEYAKSISKLFIIDLYTLSTKMNKFDVGGYEFVYPKVVENYKINVEDTLYKYMEDNSTGKRYQQLPTVSSIKVDSIRANKFKITEENTTYEGYKLNLSWKYEKNMEYDDSAEIIVIKVDNKLYVAEKN